MADTNVQILADRADIVAVADAVRAKTGTTAALTLGGMVTAIEDINVGEDPVLQNKTVTPTTSKQTITADSGYDGLDTVTVNAMPTATQATPSISVSSSGLITASATQTAGYVAAGTKSATKQLTTQAAKTITPSTSSQTAVASGRYTTGAVTVKGDINLKAANIAEGVSIFGVTGTHSGGIDTSDATATAEMIFKDETAYANGEKVTGTFTIDNELAAQDNLITQIQTALQNKASATPILQAKTVTPTASAQNVTPDSGYDGLSKVTVNAIPSTYVKPTTTKSATTYTPTTSNQTIAAGTYCSGTQTIKGDANLKAENIAEGVSIFGITGTHSGGSGGGSMETCTITVADAFADGFPLEIITTTISNGVETPYVFLHEYGDNTSSPPYTISNVKCGSIIAIICNKAYASVPYVETSNGSVLISACQVAENRHGGYALVYVFTAPITANAHSTIVVDSQ